MNQLEIKRRQIRAFSIILALITVLVLSRYVGFNGVTYLVICIEIYGIFSALVSGGLGDGLGKILRIRNGKGQYKNVEKMKNNAFKIQLCLGLLGTVLMFLIGEWLITKVYFIQYSSLLLMIIAPTVLFRTFSSVFSGYIKGDNSEHANCVGDCLRPVLLLVFSLFFTNLLKGYGQKVSHLLGQDNFKAMYQDVGIAIAFTLSEFFVLLFLLIVNLGNKKNRRINAQEGMRILDSFSDSLRILTKTRIHKAMIMLLSILPITLSSMLFIHSGVNSEVSVNEYGVYITSYVCAVGIIVALINIIILPVIGTVFLFLRKNEIRYAKNVFQNGYHISMVHSLFFSVFIGIMSDVIACGICAEYKELLSGMLQSGSMIVVFSVCSFYAIRILLATGKKTLLLGSFVLMNLVSTIAAVLFLKTQKIGILSIVYSVTIGMAVLWILVTILSYKQMKVRFDFLQVIIMPVVAACASGLISLLLSKLFIPHLGNLFTCIICIIFGIAVYWICLLLLRNFREQDLEQIPGNRIIQGIGQLLRVF